MLLSLLLHGVAISVLITVAGEWAAPPRPLMIDLALIATASPPGEAGRKDPAPPAPAPPRPVAKPSPPPRETPPVAVEAVPQAVAMTLALSPAPAPSPSLVPAPKAASVTTPSETSGTAEPLFPEPGVGSARSPSTTPAADSNERVTREPASARERYLAEHFAYIRKRVLGRLNYPAIARRQGWSGEVRVAFVIRADGCIDELRIERSCGRPILDREALAAVRRAAPFPPPPVVAELVLPVTFELR